MKPILTINLKAIQDNYRYIQSICNAEIAASVKADSYGLGADKIVPALCDAGCKRFFVATMEEGIRLRGGEEKSIYILNGFTESTIPDLISYNLTPVINTPEQLNLWQEHCSERSCIIHVDTGMNRLGINLDDFMQISILPHNTEFLMSHLACDGDIENLYNKRQLEKFIRATAQYPTIQKSLSASGGVFLGPEYHFDLARVGAAIYGVGARIYTKLQNPVHLSAPIIQIRKCEQDEYAGYGATKLVKKGSILATIPIGYADGFSRFFSNNGMLYLGDKPAEIIGRISMDLTIIDVTNHNAQIGDMVEILGPNLYPDDLAARSGTIGYEVITSLRSGRFERAVV
jgi:alanine racemase